RRPGRSYPKQRACSDCAKRVRDHRNAATGKLHRDREGCKRYHRGCSGTGIRSVIIRLQNSERTSKRLPRTSKKQIDALGAGLKKVRAKREVRKSPPQAALDTP